MKTVLLLRGPIRYTETIMLGFMGENDATLDLVLYSTNQDELCVAQGIINPERNTLLVDGSLPPHIRRTAIDAALNETDVDLVVSLIPGISYKGECQHSHNLLANGIRVVWAFTQPMPSLKAQAELIAVQKSQQTFKIDTIVLTPGRAWSQLCGMLGIPV